MGPRGKDGRMERIKVTTKAQLDALEKNSALTWVGLIADDENLKAAFDWIERFTPVRTRRAHVIDGATMNLAYGLTGENAYKDDLTIVAVMLDDIEDPMKIAIPRFQVEGRWFDDIVENNRRREEENG